MKKGLILSLFLILIFCGFRNVNTTNTAVGKELTVTTDKMQINYTMNTYKSISQELGDKKMKTILVDAINAFVIIDEGINPEMYKLLEEYSNKKIILTGANDEQMEKFGLDKMPYEVFTLKHDPEKTNPEYYRTMLKHFNLNSEDVIYFEHNLDAVQSAESVGIKTFYYEKDKKDLETLKHFIDKEL